MKKIISLFTMFALLISICTVIPISVSAEDSTVEDLSQYLDNAKRYDDFKIPDESLSNLMDAPLTAKALTYADIEQYSWSLEYNESFFNDNFLLFIKWFEPVGVEPPIYSLSSMIRKGDTMEIELEGDAETLGPDEVRIYCAAIELPRSLCDLEYTAVYNKWIYIFTAKDLKAFANDVNSGNTYEGKTVVLDKDIDLSQICGEDINGEEVSWEPIGHGVYIDNVCPAFKGVFDGCGHEIKNLYVNKNLDYDAVGLFGDIINGTVKNLTVSGSVHGEGLFTGGIAGTISDGEIINCVNKARVTGTGFCIGGIAGVNYGAIKCCENVGEIQQNGEYVGDAGFFSYYVAGIVGLNGSSSVKGVVEDCCNIGEISGGSENKGSYPNEDMIAGIVGFNDYGVVKNCYNAGVLSAEKYDVGAIAGINDINVTLRNGVIENCYYLRTEDFNKYYHAVALDRNSEDTTVYSNNTEEFASGKVAYLLGEAWGQKIGVDEYPVIGGDKVYLVNGEYTNNAPDLEVTTVFYDSATNEVITEFNDNQIVHGIMTVTNKRDTVSRVSFSYSMIKDGENIEPPNATAPISIEPGADYQYSMATDGSSCDTFYLSAVDYTDSNPTFYGEGISKAQSVEPTPTPPVKEVTVEPPTVSVPSGTVPIGTAVTISPTSSHIAYSINGGEWQYEYFAKTITITENTSLTVKSWVDVLEEGTNYITPEAVYTYTVDNSAKYPYEITLLRFADASGNEIVLTEQGKSFIVEADIVKHEGRDEKDYLFVAVYDEDGALMSMDYVKAKFAIDSDCSFGFNIPAQKKAVGSVKAFVWNTFNSMEPLAETKILAPVVFE